MRDIAYLWWTGGKAPVVSMEARGLSSCPLPSETCDELHLSIPPTLNWTDRLTLRGSGQPRSESAGCYRWEGSSEQLSSHLLLAHTRVKLHGHLCILYVLIGANYYCEPYNVLELIVRCVGTVQEIKPELLSHYGTGVEPTFQCFPRDEGAKSGTSFKNLSLLNECIDNDVHNCRIVYTSEYKSFATEWNLICNEKYKVALVQSVWMFGVMSGALVLGGLADIIGRLKTLMLALLGTIAFEGFSAFAPTYLIMVVFSCIPESPRWLASEGRSDEAKAVLEAIAKQNLTSSKLPKQWHLSSINKGKDKKQRKGLGLLVSHSYIAIITLILLYTWFVNGASYYALTMAASDLGGNIYVSTALNGLVEIPAGFVTMCVIDSGEIFPTVIRNSGMGIVSVSSRIGGMLSPFILMLGDVMPNLQFTVLGLLTLLSGLLNLKLPETLGLAMPETISDVLAFRNSSKTVSHSKYKKLEMEETETDQGVQSSTPSPRGRNKPVHDDELPLMEGDNIILNKI
ncbi:Solute carrier family 22 member 1 [Portunus trituberculatus]|uniref:Solute carrier family 22 member 1 n=1 Tax=Portunus trituberculatus TaxID=210409 RepID=A0A5B7CXX3_PORTR|nr:Solute carrier family 22 member 1 [Portunus trituberculatus]